LLLRVVRTIPVQGADSRKISGHGGHRHNASLQDRCSCSLLQRGLARTFVQDSIVFEFWSLRLESGAADFGDPQRCRVIVPSEPNSRLVATTRPHDTYAIVAPPSKD
jgi:hypothetical protein